MHVTGPITPHEALRIYLQDHHAGAQAGIALARRAAASHRGADAGPVLEGLVADLVEDEQVLERIMRALGAERSPIKDIGARLLELGGRLKLNGQLLGRSPLSSVVEFEGLLSGVKSKQHVWMLLRDATDVDLDREELDRMVARADDQLDRLHDLWGRAAATAFPTRV